MPVPREVCLYPGRCACIQGGVPVPREVCLYQGRCACTQGGVPVPREVCCTQGGVPVPREVCLYPGRHPYTQGCVYTQGGVPVPREVCLYPGRHPYTQGGVPVSSEAPYIIYCIIKSETDNNILLSDLIQLQTWSNKWQMEFNIPKCVHLPITNQKKTKNQTQTTFVFPLWCATLHSLQPPISWNKIRY